MAGQYRVDIDEMEAALHQLYGMVRRMDAVTSKARHRTGLPRESLGTGFDEAYEVYAEHAAVKAHIEDIAAHLNELAEEFSKKLRRTREAYEEAEYQA